VAEYDEPMGAWTGYYKIEYLNEESAVTDRELLDSVFSKIEKIQRQGIVGKIARLEYELSQLDHDLTVFLEERDSTL